MNVRQFRVGPLALSAALVFAVAGCGSEGGPRPRPIAGRVTLDGRPLEKGVITFVSATNPEQSSGGVIEGGAYEIPADDGLVAGSYRVSVVSNQATGRQVKDPENPGAKIAEQVQAIPDRYNVRTQLTAEVKDGAENAFDFDLTGSRLAGKAPAATSRR